MQSVWLEMDRLFRPGQRVLDINCGTGVDARRLCSHGIQVMACDASPEMISVARRGLDTSPCRGRLELRTLAIEQVGQLTKEGLYDGILSNFSGLNCVADLPCVARDLAGLVRPGGKMILCLFGRFCLWEMLWWILHGKFNKAFRRLARERRRGEFSAGLQGFGSIPFGRLAIAGFSRPIFAWWVGKALALLYLPRIWSLGRSVLRDYLRSSP